VLNIVTKFSTTASLTAYLLKFHTFLGKRKKDEQNGMEDVARQLVAPELLSHINKDVRALVGRCINVQPMKRK